MSVWLCCFMIFMCWFIIGFISGMFVRIGWLCLGMVIDGIVVMLRFVLINFSMVVMCCVLYMLGVCGVIVDSVWFSNRWLFDVLFIEMYLCV